MQRSTAASPTRSNGWPRCSRPPDTGDAEAIALAAARLAETEQRRGSGRAERLTVAEKERFDAEAAIAAARTVERQATGEETRLAAEQKALAAILESGGAAGFRPVLDAIRVARGYEAALAAALADGLEAALDPAAPAYWRGPRAPAGAAASLPAGVEPLTPKIGAPPALGWSLGHVGIVKDAETGDRLAASLSPGQILVTSEGGLWRWDGFTRHPGAASPAAVRLEQRNRLEQVERELTDARGVAQAATAALEAADRTLSGAAAAEKQARGDVMSATATLERARGELAQRKRDAEARSIARQTLVDSLALAEADHAGTASALAALAETLAALPDAATARAELEALRGGLAVARNELAACQSERDRLGREEAARNQRLAAIARERQEWRDRTDRAAARLAELDTRAVTIEATRARLAQDPARLAEMRQRILSELTEGEAARGQAADRVLEAEAAQQAADRALVRNAEAAIADSREARVRAEAALAAVLEEYEQLKLRARERLGDEAAEIDLAKLTGLAGLSVDKLPDTLAAEARFEKLVRDRENIGPVNLRAEIEVAELDAEIQRMTAERDELVAAISRLRQAVHSLNREARERLTASFGTIDAHFRQLFERLFGGGKAELKLTDSDDPLEAGLEILASPPGKKLQSLSLLSGGEQALTAIALIFAMFLTNPSPVCVLDEVDAPLDDANVDRFCLLVAEIAASVGTRFLIITHHRLTMARMDRLYGVTMSERGVSKLVSVDLRRADELRAAE